MVSYIFYCNSKYIQHSSLPNINNDQTISVLPRPLGCVVYRHRTLARQFLQQNRWQDRVHQVLRSLVRLLNDESNETVMHQTDIIDISRQFILSSVLHHLNNATKRAGAATARPSNPTGTSSSQISRDRPPRWSPTSTAPPRANSSARNSESRDIRR